jgi:hypothetical protein
MVLSLAWIIFFNFMTIFFSVTSGLEDGDIMKRFRERETVTILSGLMLILTSAVSLFIYLLKKWVRPPGERYGFWLLSALGFFFLCMDEMFMIHEGIDEGVGRLFAQNIKGLNLDNFVITGYGLIACTVCYYFRSAILLHRSMWLFLALGGLGLVGTVAFHSLERIDIIYEVAEESFKIVGVSFFLFSYFMVLMSTLDQISIRSHPIK